MAKIGAIQVDSFTMAYLNCALWTDEPDDSDARDNWNIHNINHDSLFAVIEDCSGFQESNSEMLEEWDSSQAGHDYWLTRNGHGAGFWCRDFGSEVSRKALTDASHAAGEKHVVEGDDGYLYFE